MSLTFVSTASAQAGSSFHVTVYLNGSLQDPNAVTLTWANVPAAVTVTPDAPGGLGGFTFASPSVVAQTSVTAHDGVSSGSIVISFTASPLEFTSP